MKILLLILATLNLSPKLSVGFSWGLSSAFAVPNARARNCEVKFITEAKAKAIITDWAKGDKDHDALVAFKSYLKLADDKKFSDLLPKGPVFNLLTDKEMFSYIQTFREVIESVSARAENPDELFLDKLEKVLKGMVPAETIAKRISDFKKKVTVETLRRALGDLTVDELGTLIHGGNPLKPTKTSWLGKYLSESGAETLPFAFSDVPNERDAKKRGPKRLVVAVSESSLPTFKKYFLNLYLMSVWGHALVSHNGQFVSYHAALTEFRLPSENYILPQIVLKTTEANRMAQFWEFHSQEIAAGRTYANGSKSVYPWLVDDKYCAAGGYGMNCTHYIANIPVGDDLVDAYAFPPSFEGGGSTRPISKKLRNYDTEDELMARVWKVPGNEQFADVLGCRKQNLLGEMASPGFLVHTLLSKPGLDRVPIVFLVVKDHTQKISEDFDYTAEGAH